MSEKSLLVGLDLNDDYTQIGCYNEKTFEAVCLGKEQEEGSQLIPTVLAVKNDTKEWFYGEEALQCVKGNRGELVDHILRKILKKEKFILFGNEVTPQVVLTRFFRKVLSLLKVYHPTNSILKLVVTIDNQSKDLSDSIYASLSEIGIEKDRVLIQNHRQSYLYYAISQNKELWMNDVGLFDYGEKGLYYYQITIDKRRIPMIVGVSEKDYSDTLSFGMEGMGSREDDLCYIFENIAQSAIHKQIISTLYMIGKGFDGDWVDSTLQSLCVGRRVFKGKNLYVKGACYAARELSGKGKLEEFIFLDEGMLTSHISTKVYIDAKHKEIILAKAGTPWYEVDRYWNMIPDEEDEMQILVKNIITKETARHLIPIEGIEGRPNRMTRLSIRIRMSNSSNCIITIKDLGFGDFYSTSNRIWERTIQI